MKIFVMRHGTTVWNEKGIIQGRSNNRLSEKGKAEVKKRAEEYRNQKFDVIFVSPLMRTMQTANLMNEFHNAKIIKDKRLLEIEQGIFTGRFKDSLTEKEKRLRMKRDKGCNLENYESVYKRCDDFINELKNLKYENILIITHNVNTSFISNILGNIKADFNNDRYLRNFDNAEIRFFEIK